LVCLGLLVSVSFFILKRNNPNLLTDKRKPNPFDRAVFLYFSGLAALYTYIISLAMAPFRCLQQFDGSLTLVRSPELDCYDVEWRKHWFVIVLGLSYIIAVPACFGYILWTYHRNKYSNAFQFRFGFLVRGYKKNFYWWSLFQLFRKTFLVMVIDLSSSYNPYLRTLMVLLVLLSTVLVEAITQPRIEGSLSRMLTTLYGCLSRSECPSY
jgi:hypothetical protein